eukprot:s162_g38.t1
MATLPAPPSGAAAAINLFGGNQSTFAVTAPAVPAAPAPPPTRDDDVLGAVMAKAGARLSVPSAPPLTPTALSSISGQDMGDAKTADGHLVRIEQSRNDASVLEGFLRKHAPSDSVVEGMERRKPPPIAIPPNNVPQASAQAAQALQSRSEKCAFNGTRLFRLLCVGPPPDEAVDMIQAVW